MSNDGFADVIKHSVYSRANFSDEELVELVRAQGPTADDALNALLGRYERDVYRACVAFLRDPAVAEEASQESLIRVYRAVRCYRGQSTFRTWLYRVVRNQCHTAAVKQARHRVCQPWDESLIDHHIVESDFTAALAAGNAVRSAMRHLSARDREILHLRYFSDLSLNAIARRLDLGLSGTKMRLYRAMARFKTVYLEQDAGLDLAAQL